MSTVDVKGILHQWAEAWSAHDMERVAAIFTDDCVYEDVTFGAVNSGKEELRAFGSGFLAAVPDLHVELSTTCVADDHGAMEWTMSGTQTGEMPGMPAAGKTFSLRGAPVVELRDGKLTRCSDYWDLVTLLKQHGLMS
jgi:steroid delta-isomerase-like uncharacterized protein